MLFTVGYFWNIRDATIWRIFIQIANSHKKYDLGTIKCTVISKTLEELTKN